MVLLRSAQALLVIALSAVAWQSLVPVRDVIVTVSLSDKAIHGVGYAVLGLIGMLAQRRSRPILTWLGVVVFGVVLEILQGMLGYRSYEPADMVADAVGAGVGVLIGLFVRSRLPRTGWAAITPLDPPSASPPAPPRGPAVSPPS